MGALDLTSNDARQRRDPLEVENARLRRLLEEAGAAAERAFLAQAEAAEDLSRERDASRHAEEHRGLLTNELQHRLKNTLAVVQALASQTFRQGAALVQAREAFAARLAALGHAHDVLTEAAWQGATVGVIVEGALRPYRIGEDRFRIDGPSVEVAAKPALALALALNELATNAVKYGALSRPGGHVVIVWDQAGGAFRLRWSEHGGPTVTPPTRRGFGSRLIERSLALEFGGTVEIAYEPTGVVCAVTAPLDAVRAG